MDIEALIESLAANLRAVVQYREDENKGLKDELLDLKRENAQLKKQVAELKKTRQPLPSQPRQRPPPPQQALNFSTLPNRLGKLESHFEFDDGATPLLQYCLLNRADDCARKMIEAGTEVNARSAKFTTALHITALRNLKSLSLLLIEKGVDVNPSDSKGQKPLHYAAQRNSIGAAKALIEADAWIDARDKDRNTPLHIACQYGSYEVAKFLVDEGCDLNAVNVRDEDPYECFLESAEEKCRTRWNIETLMRNLFDSERGSDVPDPADSDYSSNDDAYGQNVYYEDSGYSEGYEEYVNDYAFY